MVEIYGKTIKGRRRQQQDNICYISRPNVCMATVCDGMGGLAEGDWASHVTVELIQKHFNNLKDFSDIPGFYRREIAHLDDVICQLEDDKSEKIISGTTFASVIIVNNQLFIGSVGDSRIYIYSKRENKLQCVTREHNYKLCLDRQVQEGQISQQDYIEELPKADCLVSYLGVGQMELIDVNDEPYCLESGDLVLLCTDGVYRSLNEQEMLMLVRDYVSVESLTETFMDKIGEKNYKSQDNAGLIVMKYV